MSDRYVMRDDYYKFNEPAVHDTKKLITPEPFALSERDAPLDMPRWLAYCNYDELAKKMESALRHLLPALNIYVLRQSDLLPHVFFAPATVPLEPSTPREFPVGRKRVFFPFSLFGDAVETAIWRRRFVIFAPQDINDNILYLVSYVTWDDYRSDQDNVVRSLARELLQSLNAHLQVQP